MFIDVFGLQKYKYFSMWIVRNIQKNLKNVELSPVVWRDSGSLFCLIDCRQI